MQTSLLILLGLGLGLIASSASAQPVPETFVASPQACAALARGGFVAGGRAFPGAQRDLNMWRSQLDSLPRPAEGTYDAFYSNLQIQVRGKAADLDAVARQAADSEMLMIAYRDAEPDPSLMEEVSRWPAGRFSGGLEACQAAAPTPTPDWRVLSAPGGALAFDMGSLVRIGPAAYLTAARTFPAPQPHSLPDIVERTVDYQLSVTTYRFDCTRMQSGMVLTRFHSLDGVEVGRFNGAVLPMTSPTADPIGLAASIAGLACGRFGPPAAAEAVSGDTSQMLTHLRRVAGL